MSTQVYALDSDKSYMSTSARFQIRKSVYRDRLGFTLSGPRCRIFDPERSVIEAIRNAYRELDGDALQQRVSDLLLRKVKVA